MLENVAPPVKVTYPSFSKYRPPSGQKFNK